MNFAAGLNHAHGAGKPTNRTSLSAARFRMLSMEPAQDEPNRNIIRIIWPFWAVEAMPCPYSWLAALKAGYGARLAPAPKTPIAQLPPSFRSEDAAFTGSILLLIIVVAGVVSLIGRVMRRGALNIPQLSIHAIGGEQLGMRAALDRLAA